MHSLVNAGQYTRLVGMPEHRFPSMRNIGRSLHQQRYDRGEASSSRLDADSTDNPSLGHSATVIITVSNPRTRATIQSVVSMQNHAT